MSGNGIKNGIAFIGAILLLWACGAFGRDSADRGDPDSTSDAAAEDVILAGQSPSNGCERAMVAHAEYVRDAGIDGSGVSEQAMFDACTFPEFAAANQKMTEFHRYPGDGSGYVERNCRRTLSEYRGSRLCESL